MELARKWWSFLCVDAVLGVIGDGEIPMAELGAVGGKQAGDAPATIFIF